jgi:septal ring factor EnvC (AmiA/AmiB activator)
MDWQTFLNIILGLLSAYLLVRNFLMNTKKETQRESAEMAEIRTKLSQVMDMLQDLQKDIRTSSAEYRELAGRVIKVETRIEEIFERLKKLEDDNGKS